MLVLIIMQDATLRQRAGRHHNFVPTSMDKMVIAFRHWLHNWLN